MSIHEPNLTRLGPDTATAEPSTGLRGRMGASMLAFMVLACLSPLTGAAGYIGLGIATGNGIGVPFMYLLVGLALLFFAVGYVALIRRIARPGGFYAYVTAGLGKRVGLGGAFLTVSTYLLTTIGLVTFCGITLSGTLESMFGIPNVQWWICAIPFLAVTAVLSYFNVAVSARFLCVILVIEVAIVLFFDLVVAHRGGPSGISADSFTYSSLMSGNTALAFLYALSVYSGFESAALYYEEVRDPQRTISRATYAVVIAIGLFYTVTSWMFITAFGSRDAVAAISSDYSNAFGRAVQLYLGTAMHDVMNLVLLTGLLASLLSSNNLLARYAFSLGVDRVTPTYFGQAHPKHGSPARAATLVHGALFVGLILLAITRTSANDVLALTASAGMYGFLLMFLLVAVTVLVYFIRNPESTLTGRISTFVSPLVSIVIFAVAAVYVAKNFDLIIGDHPALTVLLQVIIYSSFVVGVAYASYLAIARKHVYARIGRMDFETEVSF
ncbi:APC family permease [Mycobacterium sp. CBMA293]|nr:APC family permease [Mycolicibacterium sp. CBMA 360]MUL62798.1 APC family permease [Mycolicibacterium sp. CBMA 335]MUL69669.1 APC family permease [Mycolicibacterium sp. CBMA 311]MUL97448.1 APC family permease [Mycolicibacterium sp. CBMA 230]MUM15292.1 APC family permease [Mycolicibacterium sp. CBMA 293]MUM33106.1 APC family permease [Mycolicibacterium sp. CBMA 361]